MAFEDITILGLDEESSSRVDSKSALFNVVFKLSATAPWEWANYFNDRWAKEFYMTKRKADASGSAITITCIPDDIEKDHMPHLNKVIADTNSAYRTHVAKSHVQEESRELQERHDAITLSNLGNRLFKK